MSFSCGPHGWRHALNPCPHCMKSALERIAGISSVSGDGYWIQIQMARGIARAAIAKAEGIESAATPDKKA